MEARVVAMRGGRETKDLCSRARLTRLEAGINNGNRVAINLAPLRFAGKRFHKQWLASD